MLLVGFSISLVGIAYAMHTNDVYLGMLISVGGVASMWVALP
jgi:hypothetical protein